MSLSRFDQCCFSRVTLLVVPENHGLSSPVRDSWESTMSSSLVKKSQHIWNDEKLLESQEKSHF
jgi:hypothetical protein